MEKIIIKYYYHQVAGKIPPGKKNIFKQLPNAKLKLTTTT